MQCTPQQIEEKKRLAQLKLLSKRKRDDNLMGVHNRENHQLEARPNSSSPNKQFVFKPYTKTKPTLPFYGQKKVITANIHLISEYRFAVDLSRYSVEAIDVFKTIPTKSYSKSRSYSNQKCNS